MGKVLDKILQQAMRGQAILAFSYYIDEGMRTYVAGIPVEFDDEGILFQYIPSPEAGDTNIIIEDTGIWRWVNRKNLIFVEEDLKNEAYQDLLDRLEEELAKAEPLMNKIFEDPAISEKIKEMEEQSADL